MRGLSRKQKLVRNLLLSILLAGLLWGLVGFPPYTVRGMCRQIQREYFLPELETLYVKKESGDNPTGWGKVHLTFVLARAGEEYLSFQYRREGLRCEQWFSSAPEIGEVVLCTARDGTMYVLGPFAEAASATAVVTAEKNRGTPQAEQRDFVLEGEKLADEVFSFRYRREDHNYFPEDWPEEDWDLENISEMWYRERTSAGSVLLHAELPCVVTLYREDGTALETLHLTIGTYDLVI